LNMGVGKDSVVSVCRSAGVAATGGPHLSTRPYGKNDGERHTVHRSRFPVRSPPAFLSVAIHASRLVSSLSSPIKGSSCVGQNHFRGGRTESASVVNMADSLVGRY
jgi:hypothetical protein